MAQFYSEPQRFQKRRIVNLLGLLLIAAATLTATKADSCFDGDKYPEFIIEDAQNPSAATWNAIFYDNGALYLAGAAQSSTMFPGFANSQQAFAAKYSTTTKSFVWAKLLVDSDRKAKSATAVAVNTERDTVVVAGTLSDQYYNYLFFLDPDTGALLHRYFYLKMKYYHEFMSPHSILFTATNRLYLTGRNYDINSGKQGGSNYDGSHISVVCIDYRTPAKVFQKLTVQTSFGGGSVAAMLDVSTSTIDGYETILLGGGYSPFVNGKPGTMQENGFQLAIFKIVPGGPTGTGVLTSIQIPYNLAYTSSLSTEFQYFSHMVRPDDSSVTTLYAVTRSADVTAPGKGAMIAILPFDSGWTTVTSPQLYSFSGPDYSDYTKVLNIRHMLHSSNDYLLGVSFNIAASETFYWQFYGTSLDVFRVYTTMTTLAAVFVSSTIYSQELTNQWFLETYIAGQATLSELSGGTTAGVVDAAFVTMINKASDETCSAETTVTKTWSTISLISNSVILFSSSRIEDKNENLNVPTYRSYDLDFSTLVSDTLCSPSYTTLTPTAGSFAGATMYTSYFGSTSCPFTPITIDETCDDIQWVYSINDEGCANCPAQMMTIEYDASSSNIILSLDTNMGSFINTEGASNVFEVTGTTQSGVSESFQFTVIVYSGVAQHTCTEYTCAETMDTDIVISSPYAEYVLAYNVGENETELNVSEFTVVSTVCLSTDILYSMETSSFSTFTALKFLVQTDSNDDAGIYALTVDGEISTGLSVNPSGSTVINLTVVETCVGSTEANAITALTFDSGLLSYKQQSATQSLTVAEFTVDDTTPCTSSDLVYTLFSPDLAGIITFDAGTRTLTFYDGSNSENNLGEYTVEIRAAITTYFSNQGNDNYASSSFILSIQTCASSYVAIVLTPSSVAAQTYYITFASTTITIDKFGIVSDFCELSDIVYEMLVTPTPSNGSLFVFDATTRELTWYTTDEADSGLYTIEIKGTIATSNIEEQSSSFTFSIDVQSLCYSGIVELVVLEEVSSLTYVIGEAQLEHTFVFSDTSDDEQCWYDWTLTLYNSATGASIGSSDTPISFDSTKRKIEIETSSKSQAGDFVLVLWIENVLVSGDTNRYFYQNLTVTLELPENYAPYYSNLDSEIMTYNLTEVGETLSLGTMETYLETDTAIVESFEVSPKVSKQYFKIDSSQEEISINTDGLNKTAKENDVAHTITIRINDQNPINPKSATYVLNFIVPGLGAIESSFEGVVISNETSEENFIFQRPKWTTVQTNMEGLVTIGFSKLLVVPKNLTHINSTVLRIEIVSSGKVSDEFLGFNWWVHEFTSSSFTIKLFFDYPLYIQSNRQFEQEKVLVKCVDPSLFATEQGNITIANNSGALKALPSQLPNNDAHIAALYAITDAADSGGKTVVIGTFVLNAFLSVSLNNLWGMINTLQIISHLQDFSNITPANVNLVYDTIIDLSNFEIFPTETFLKWLGLLHLNHEDDEDEESHFRILEEDAEEEIEEDPEEYVGMFEQLGTMLFVLMLISVFCLVLLLFWPFRNRFLVIDKIFRKLKLMIFWNSTLRFLIEGYMNFALTTLIVLSTRILWTTHLDRAESLFSFFTLFAILVAPIALTRFLRANYRKYRHPDFKKKFSSVISNLNFRVKQSANYFFIFCYRRLIQAILIVFLPKYSAIQIQLMTFMSTIVIIIFAESKVFLSGMERRIEYFNEACVLLCCYHSFLFTEFIADPVWKYGLGFSLLVFAGFNVFVNLTFLVYNTGTGLARKYKITRQKYRVFKWQKKRAARMRALLEKQRRRSEARKEALKDYPEQVRVIDEQLLEAEKLFDEILGNKRSTLVPVKESKRISKEQLVDYSEEDISQVKQQLSVVSEVNSEAEDSQIESVRGPRTKRSKKKEVVESPSFRQNVKIELRPMQLAQPQLLQATTPAQIQIDVEARIVDDMREQRKKEQSLLDEMIEKEFGHLVPLQNAVGSLVGIEGSREDEEYSDRISQDDDDQPKTGRY